MNYVFETLYKGRKIVQSADMSIAKITLNIKTFI